MGNDAGESSAASLYWVAVRIIRDDWAAEWWAARVIELALLYGLPMTALSEDRAGEVLRELATRIEQLGRGVQWCTGDRQCFVLEGGGVLVTVQVEGSEIDIDGE